MLTWFLLLFFAASGQYEILTTAEKSDYASTSTYQDVMQFIHSLENSPILKTDYFATTVEGKELPLLIIADPLPEHPGDLNDDSRMVVYLQANIHAGEVEGKEATQMLARDLVKGVYPNLLKNQKE